MNPVTSTVHPRLAQAHHEFHSTTAYRDALRLVDSGHVASILPHTHRNNLKMLIELMLAHFHDLGFAQGLKGTINAGAAWASVEESEGQALRLRLEGVLGRINQDFQRVFRDAETKWKQVAPTDGRKQSLAGAMNDVRRDATRFQGLDHTALYHRIMDICQDGFNFGFERGLAIHNANLRKARLGIIPEQIVVEVQLLGDVIDDSYVPPTLGEGFH
ncbi:MAG: hypothetical protein ABI743_01720 [bacterium]